MGSTREPISLVPRWTMVVTLLYLMAAFASVATSGTFTHVTGR